MRRLEDQVLLPLLPTWLGVELILFWVEKKKTIKNGIKTIKKSLMPGVCMLLEQSAMNQEE